MDSPTPRELAPDAALPAAPRLLLTGAAGTGKTWRALGAVRDIATRRAPHGGAAERPGAALLVLPTFADVQHARRIALSRWDARGLLDEVFATFTGAGERFLDRFRVDVLPSAAARDRLLVAALADVDARVFAAVAGAAAFRARLLRLIKELKQSGDEPAEIADRLENAADALSVPARERLTAFVAVFRAVHRRLADTGLSDHEDVLRALARRLEDRPPRSPPRRLVFDGFEDFTPIEERILDRLSSSVVDAGGQVIVTCPFDPRRAALFVATGPWRERRLAAGFEEWRVIPRADARPAPLARLARELFSEDPGEAPTPGGSRVAWILGGDDEDEAEAIARHVRRAVLGAEIRVGDRPARWHDVAIVVPDLGRDASRLASALRRIGVPVRAEAVAPSLGRTPLVRALRGALDVVAGDIGPGEFDPFALHAWLAWCVAAEGDVEARRALDAFEVCHRTDGAPRDFRAFLADAPDAIAPFVVRLESARVALHDARGVEAFEGLAEAMPDLAPLPAPSARDDAGRPSDARRDALVAAAHAASARLVRVLSGLADATHRTGVGPASIAEAVADLLAHADALSFEAPDRRLDAVSVIDMETARFREPALVVVAGLEAGRVPRGSGEDPLLADADREALVERDPRLRLPRARDRDARERRLLYSAMTSARHTLWLARPTMDARGDQVLSALPMRALERCVTPTILHDTRAPGSLAPSRDLVASERDLVHIAAHPSTPRPLAEALARALPTTATALERGRARRPTRLHVPPPVAARLASGFDVMSPSELDVAHRCRAQFAFRHVLRVPEDDLSFEPREVEPAEEGQLLHAAFRTALLRGDRTALEIARDVLAEAGIESSDESLLEAELVRAIELLRRREAALPAAWRADPAFLERSFGAADEIALDDGATRLLLKGRIDRVDVRSERGTPPVAIVVDYKRSPTTVESSASSERNGLGLQLRLYALAVERLARVRVVGLEWVASLARLRRGVYDQQAPPDVAWRREEKSPISCGPGQFAAMRDDAVASALAAVADLRAARLDRAPILATTCTSCSWKRPCRPDRDAVERTAAERRPPAPGDEEDEA